MDKVPGGAAEAERRLEKAHEVVTTAIEEHLEALQELHRELSERLEDMVIRNDDLITQGQDKKLKGVQNWLEEQLRAVSKRLRSPPVIVGQPRKVRSALRRSPFRPAI